MLLAKRLAFVAVLLIALSMGLFYLLHVLPGSPEEALIASNPELSSEDVARIRTLRGLDRPITERYACWLFGRGEETIGQSDGACAYWPSAEGILGGDLGYSRVHKLRVSEVLAVRMPATFSLMLPAFLLSLVLAIVLGISSAVKNQSAYDRWVSRFCFAGMSLPVHWISLMAILFFAVCLGLFPAGGIRNPLSPSFGSMLHHAVLPISVLSLGFAARWTRFVRTSTLEVLNLDFVRTARASGVEERTLLVKHVLPNALLPLITVVAASAPALFSGALVVETVFTYPGMGVLIFESLMKNDHLVAIVVFLVYASLSLLFALVADLAYTVVDPRIRIAS
jgi:peptide/nickel transport system permease protein